MKEKEILDLYNNDREKTGRTMVRGQSSQQKDGDYRLVVHICIFNSKGEMLIQQRQHFKEYFPNKWDFTAGGAVISGETSSTAGEREVFEELGLKISLKNEHPLVSLNFKDGFGDIYLIQRDVDIEKLKLQYEEVKAVKWATKEEIFSMIDDKTFIDYNKGIVEMLFFKRNHSDNFVNPTETYRNPNLIPVQFFDNLTEKQMEDENTVKYAVIIAKYKEKYIFCKHVERTTYELPGGHREIGESIEETARRELYEETGALKFYIKPICAYKVEDYGILYYAKITELEENLKSEIECIQLFDHIPDNLTYPYIHPFLLIEAKKRQIINF